MSLLFLLAAASAQQPALDCVSTPGHNCGTKTGTESFADRLHAHHQGQATAIYTPFWQCQFQNLRQHPDFSTTSSDKALAAFRSSTAKCVNEMVSTNADMDKLLATDAGYGDWRNRRKLRDRFRQDGGVLFATAAARQAGVREQLAAMIAAIPRPAVEKRDTSPERVAVETCVWEDVQKSVNDGASTADIDAQLEIGRRAADNCSIKIRSWAATSPAVREAGEPLADVEQMMQIHYVARGSLFAQGKARPFYLSKPEQLAPPNIEGGFRLVPMLAKPAPTKSD